MPPAASLHSRLAQGRRLGLVQSGARLVEQEQLGPMARARASSTIRASPVDMAADCSSTASLEPDALEQAVAGGEGQGSEAGSGAIPGPASPSAAIEPRPGTALRRWGHSHHLTVDSRPTCTFSLAEEPEHLEAWKVRASPIRARRWASWR